MKYYPSIMNIECATKDDCHLQTISNGNEAPVHDAKISQEMMNKISSSNITALTVDCCLG